MAENRPHAFVGTIPLSTFVTRLICLCMLPLLLLAGWLVFDSVRAKQAENDSQAVNLAKNFATYVDDHLSACIAALNILAVSPLLDDPTRRQDLYQEASGFFQSFGSHVILADIGMPMRMLFNTRVPFGTDLPLLPQPEGHAAAPTALKTGRPAVGDTFLGPIAKEPLIAIAVPAMREGRPVALLLSLIETAHFQEQIHEVELPSGWGLSLQDGRGETIGRQNPEADPGSTVRVVINSKVSPWSIVLESPRVTYTAQLLATATALGLGILGTALASLLGGILAGRRVGREVALLADTASVDTPPSKIREVAAARLVLDEAAKTRAKAETALRDSEKNLRLFIEHAPVAIAMFDREMRYVAVSSRWVADYRLGSQEIIGRSHYAVFPEISDAWKAVHQRGLNGEVIVADEDAFLRSDGSVQWLHWVVRPWQADGGTISGIIILTEDITRRKQAEDELRKIEERLRLALRGADLGTWDWDIDTGETVYNQRWAEMLGYKLEEIEPHVRSWETRLHPEDRARVMEQVTAHLKGRVDFYETEHRLRHKSGEWIWVLDKGRVIERDPGGRAVRACGTHLDITAGKKAQEGLRESEEKYRRIVETANEGIWAMDGAYRTTFVNPHLSRMLGYTAAEMIGRPVDTFMFAEDLQDHAAKMATRIQGGGGVYERRFRRKDGGELWAIVSATPLKDAGGNFAGSFAMFTDITGYKQAQASLRESQERYRLVADFTYDWEYWVDPSGRFLYISPSCERVSGYPASYFLEEPEGLLKIVHPEDRNILTSHIRRGLETDTPPCDLEFRIIRKDGETRWVKHTCWSVFTKDDVFAGRRGSQRDITEEKLAQQALIESEQRHRAILQTALDGVWLVDMQGRLLQVNEAYCRMSGYSGDELLNMRVADVEVVENLSTTIDHIQRIMVQGQDRFETRHRRKDGRVYDVEVSVQYKPEDGGYIVAFLRDITERTLAEARVRESRGKLEAALGSMTDGVLICDADGQFIDFNDAFAKIHRYRNKGDFPRTIADFRDVIDLLNTDGELVAVDGRPVPRALRGE
ncbi:MAG TPA: hypothetical protein DCZ69_08830, partial [Syntrophobacteraceae bacterium]|nr:hypothetical protein [Syntrophobacteraceae bacterium]